MISFSSTGFGQYAPIGALVLYSLLFLFTILFYSRHSLINLKAILTVTVALMGIIFTTCLSLDSLGHSLRLSQSLSPPALLFGLSVVPITWMVGINSLSVLLGDRKTLRSRLTYLLTWFIQALIILCAVYYANYLKPSSFDDGCLNLSKTINIFKAITCIDWIYVFLFASLLIDSKTLVSSGMFRSLVIFGALNTVRLIVDTFYLKSKDTVDEQLSFYIQLFFTDPLTVLSLFISTFYLKDLKTIESEKHINK